MEKDTFGAEHRYRPLLSISTNQRGKLLVQTALQVEDESSFLFSSIDLSVIPDKKQIVTDNPKLKELYEQLFTPENDLLSFIQTAMAFTRHIYKK